MTLSLLFKILIFVLLALILISLGSGLLFLVRDQGRTRRVVSSLTVRIVLSVALFILLIIGYLTGILKPRGIAQDNPEAEETGEPNRQ